MRFVGVSLISMHFPSKKERMMKREYITKYYIIIKLYNIKLAEYPGRTAK